MPAADSYSPNQVQQRFDERLQAAGVSVRQYCKKTVTDPRSLEAVLSGDAARTSYLTVLKMNVLLKSDLSDYDRAVIARDPETARQVEQIRRLNFIIDHVPIQSLVKEGRYDKDWTIDEVVEDVLRYQGEKSIASYESSSIQAAYSSVLRSPTATAKNYWTRSAYHHLCGFENPHPFDPQRLRVVMENLRGYSLDTANGLTSAIRALFSAGVTVSYLPSLAGIAVRGATFALPFNPKSAGYNGPNLAPGIILADTGKRYATLWFALIHELHHVLHDWQAITKARYHLSDEADLLLTERAADAAARDYWCPPPYLAEATREITNQTTILRLAKNLRVHPSIIYHLALHERARFDKWAYSRRAPALFTPSIADTLQVFQASWSAPIATHNVPHLLRAIHQR